MDKAVTVVIADDHKIIRDGIRSMIEVCDGFVVVADGNGAEVAELLKTLQPEIVIVDLSMPGTSGFDLLRIMARDAPMSKAIVLSTSMQHSDIRLAMNLGASGYVVKGDGMAALLEAFQTVMAGGKYISEALVGWALAPATDGVFSVTSESFAVLSNREREVLKLAADGLKNPMIAQRLSISSRTVETHRENIQRKLALKNQTEVIRSFIEHGIFKT